MRPGHSFTSFAIAHQHHRLAVCFKDPTLSQFYRTKQERSRAVTINGLRDHPGVYRPISTLPLAKRKLIPKATNRRRRSSTLREEEGIDSDIPMAGPSAPAKKARMSADARLVLGCGGS